MNAKSTDDFFSKEILMGNMEEAVISSFKQVVLKHFGVSTKEELIKKSDIPELASPELNSKEDKEFYSYVFKHSKSLKEAMKTPGYIS